MEMVPHRGRALERRKGREAFVGYSTMEGAGEAWIGDSSTGIAAAAADGFAK